MEQLSGDYPLNQDPGRVPSQIRRTKDFGGDVRPVSDLIPHSPWDDRHQLLQSILAFHDFLVGQFLGFRKESGPEALRPEELGLSVHDLRPFFPFLPGLLILLVGPFSEELERGEVSVPPFLLVDPCHLPAKSHLCEVPSGVFSSHDIDAVLP